MCGIGATSDVSRCVLHCIRLVTWLFISICNEIYFNQISAVCKLAHEIVQIIPCCPLHNYKYLEVGGCKVCYYRLSLLHIHCDSVLPCTDNILCVSKMCHALYLCQLYSVASNTVAICAVLRQLLGDGARCTHVNSMAVSENGL
jgi:hypothetical protein